MILRLLLLVSLALGLAACAGPPDRTAGHSFTGGYAGITGGFGAGAGE